tara:strand:- start:202 stop:426 length:225 start_codon:yes stop_codon:yes gene_type:complete
MAKKTKTKSKKKDLLKKEPKAVPNLTYEEKVAIKTSGVPGKVKKEKENNRAPAPAVQFIRARPKTAINDRVRNR